MTQRMKNIGWVAVGAIVLYWVATTLVGTVFGGPLDPPAPPAATGVNRIFQPANCAGFPIEINTAGSYELAENIAIPGGCAKDGIWVNPADTTLDLNGFTLTGVTGAGWGIIANASVTIRNGQVLNWPTGGVLVQNTKATVANVTARGNGSGIVVFGSAIVRDNVVADNVGPGIKLQGGTADIVAGNTSTGNGTTVPRDSGILLENTTGALVENNVASGNGLFGIRVTGGAGNRIEGNDVHGNGDVSQPDAAGILLEATTGAIVRNNTASGTIAPGPSGGNYWFGAGIAVRGGSSNSSVVENFVVDNAGAGIHIEGSSTITVHENTASSNNIGIFFSTVAGGGDNVFTSNTAQSNSNASASVAGIHIANTNGNLIAGNVALNNTPANYSVNLPNSVAPITTLAAKTHPDGNTSD